MDLYTLSIEEKVGQMLCFAFNGDSYNEQLQYFINDLKIGGIIYFSKNITSLKQTYELNKTLQKSTKIPLFIGIDQEGGTVQRIMYGITPLVGAMGLASTSREKIFDICKKNGEDLRCLGFNMNYAPVGDVNNNPLNPVINSRSYSDDPFVVGMCATKAFKGFMAAKVLPTIKHFPGHGNTSVDSHVGLPVVTSSKEEVENMELIPFKMAIDEGIDGVMMSHIVYECYDSLPASLSKKVITEVLRDKLGFEGLVVTDSLTMGAINDNYTVKEIVKNAVIAGVDQMIFCGRASLEDQKQIYNIFLDMAKSGEIPLDVIDKATERILKYKEKYCNKSIKEKVKFSSLKFRSNCSLAKKLSKESITVVMDKENLIPLSKKDKVLILFPEIKLFTLVDNSLQTYKSLKEYLGYEEIIIKQDLSNFALIEEKIKNGGYDKIIFATYNVTKDDYQSKVFSILNKKETIVISMRSPYDVKVLNEVSTYICLYEATSLSLKSVASILKNKYKAKGKLPIKL